jgi:hypothetical protein
MKPARGASPHSPQPGGVRRFGRRILDDAAHDPYRADAKPVLGTVCSECAARFVRGHWAWETRPEASNHSPRAGGSPKEPLPASDHTLCPACRRTHDHQPAGYLTIEGPAVQNHRAEVLALVRHEAARALADHPLQRIIDIIEHPDRIEITTTDLHVPRRIGQALRNAHHGQLQMNYGQDEISVRVHWTG